MGIQHYLTFSDLDLDTYNYLLRRSQLIKSRFKSFQPHQTLGDRTLAMIFEKASTRTRVSFEAGMYQMGGYAIFISTHDSQLGRGEPIEDSAQVFSRMVDLVMIRTFGQETLERFSRFSRVPVINGLTDAFHPCQILADIFTFVENRGDINGRTVCWIGDANNMLYTWIQAATIFDFKLQVATPASYPLDMGRLTEIDKSKISLFDRCDDAAQGADLICTDVWASMGDEEQVTERQIAFKDYRVTSATLARAKRDALFMHCLPAHRGEEVDAEVIDGDQSVVWDEAENRLHVQKALMEYLLRGRLDDDIIS